MVNISLFHNKLNLYLAQLLYLGDYIKILSIDMESLKSKS